MIIYNVLLVLVNIESKIGELKKCTLCSRYDGLEGFGKTIVSSREFYRTPNILQ